jgi:hypothetical protein
MKINELNLKERKQNYNDSDIFNIRPPKTPERFRFKEKISLKEQKGFNSNSHTISTDNLSIQRIKRNRYKSNINHIDPLKNISHRNMYYNNKKDHIKDCLRSKTSVPYYMEKYEKYRRTQDLKKDYKKQQLDKSYDYNYDDNNKVYRNITLNGKKGYLILGNDPTNFSSEYNSMLDYAKKIMLKKRIKEEKMKSDLNKSVDIPHKFKPLKRNIYNKKNVTRGMYTKNTSNFDINKSTDNINYNTGHNINYYNSNIFFDKEKDKTNEELIKLTTEYKAQRYKEKLKNLELEKEKSKANKIKRRKTDFLYEEEKRKHGDVEEHKKFCRDGNFPLQYANFKPQKEFKMKSIDELYTANNKRLYKDLSELERQTDKFVILDVARNDKFDSREIKNLFFKNGIHMFGEQTFNSYIQDGKRGKFVFNIRKDLRDKDYNQKLKKVQNILMKKQGVVFKLDNRKLKYNKKIRTDITPSLAPFRDLKSKKFKPIYF